MSAAGGVVSVPVSYLGNLLNGISGVPFGIPQLISGIHVLWLVLAGLLIKRRGAITIAGITKGIVEFSLFSFHGALILPIALAEGLVAEASFLAFGAKKTYSVYVAGGLSASANVIVLRLFVLQFLPWYLIFLTWGFSFMSGAVVAGYFGNKAVKVIDEKLIGS